MSKKKLAGRGVVDPTIVDEAASFQTPGNSAKRNGTFQVTGQGEVHLIYQDENDPTALTKLVIPNALHCPELEANLLSIRGFDKMGYKTHVENGELYVINPKTGKTIIKGKAQPENDMYALKKGTVI